MFTQTRNPESNADAYLILKIIAVKLQCTDKTSESFDKKFFYSNFPWFPWFYDCMLYAPRFMIFTHSLLLLFVAVSVEIFHLKFIFHAKNNTAGENINLKEFHRMLMKPDGGGGVCYGGKSFN